MKTAIDLKSVGNIDKIWSMCFAALHNWLLEVDGYDMVYDRINQSSNPSFHELTKEDILFVLRRLNNVTVDAISDFGDGRGL